MPTLDVCGPASVSDASAPGLRSTVTFHGSALRLRSTPALYGCVPRLRSTVTFHACALRLRSTPALQACVPRLRSMAAFHASVPCLGSTAVLRGCGLRPVQWGDSDRRSAPGARLWICRGGGSHRQHRSATYVWVGARATCSASLCTYLTR